MTTRYLCVHCDHRFEHEASDGKARCPKCMRKGGLEKLGEVEATSPRKPAWLVPVVVFAVVAALAAGYALWSKHAPVSVEGQAPLRPLSEGQLRGYLRLAHADRPTLMQVFASDDALEQFAEHEATGGDALAKARHLVAALRGRASKQAFVSWSLQTPRDTPVMAPPATLSAIAQDGARAHLYPLEVASLAVAALRTQDVPAMLAEVWAFPGDRRPPDPSGHLGYFLVAVYPGEPGEGTPTFLDPWGGHETQPDADHSRVLSDTQAAAALANTSALYTLVHENDPTHALESAQMALSLDERAPYVRGVRASVLISSGGPDEGLAELRAAAQIRSDAPRHNNLAGVFMAQRDFDGASREVAAALESAPDYAAAHATLAAIHLEQGETEQGRAELETAQRLDPELFNLPMIWASYYLRTGDTQEAARRAREAVERRGFDWQTRLSAAQVFHEAGLYDDMRRQTRQVLELAPESQRAGLREMVLQVLGSTALDQPFDEEDEAAQAAQDAPGTEGADAPAGDATDLGALPSPDFQLGGSGGLLGGEPAPADGPSLLGGGMNEPLLQLGDPSNIHLRGPGQGLHLDLDH